MCPKPSKKQIVHSIPYVTHILVVTLLSLMRGGIVRVKNQGEVVVEKP